MFNTYCFLFLFLPLVIAGYWLIPSRRLRVAWLASASFVFYSFWDVRFVGLLLASAGVDFVLALRLRASPRPKRWLAASVVFNLGVLAFFKYAMFAAGSARSLFQALGLAVEVPYFHIVLPVGISFYTFQSMSYTIDVYRKEIVPTRDFLSYLAFVSLFPQLVAGPIVRYKQLSSQLAELPSRLTAGMAAVGVALFSFGLFKKVVIADRIAARIDPLWSASEALTSPEAWTAALGYALQLYFDFSGYSDMAIGLGALLGFAFPVNFRAPYQALNPSDFWRRWHVTLGAFLRDYLYLPLGGNRASAARVRANLLIVMVLGGLWHGAAWTFVAWGAYHGLWLVLYRSVASIWDAAPKLVQRGLTLLIVIIGWVMFRASTVPDAVMMYARMFAPDGWRSVGALLPLLAALLALFAFTLLARPTSEMRVLPTARQVALAATLFTAALLLMGSGASPFLYYQF